MHAIQSSDTLEVALLRARVAISRAQDLAASARQQRQSLLNAADSDSTGNVAKCQARELAPEVDTPCDLSVGADTGVRSCCPLPQAGEEGSTARPCGDAQASSTSGGALPQVGSVDALTDTLAFLQHQQVSTLKRMHSLRTEQLQLRDHQLTLLQSLLQTEGLRVRYTSLQASALSCVSSLTAQALRALKKAIDLLLQVARGDLTEQSASLVSSLCLATDEQAEQVAGIARNVLEDCPICLVTFKAGDQLASLQCEHWHHYACLELPTPKSKLSRLFSGRSSRAPLLRASTMSAVTEGPRFGTSPFARPFHLFGCTINPGRQHPGHTRRLRDSLMDREDKDRSSLWNLEGKTDPQVDLRQGLGRLWPLTHSPAVGQQRAAATPSVPPVSPSVSERPKRTRAQRRASTPSDFVEDLDSLSDEDEDEDEDDDEPSAKRSAHKKDRDEDYAAQGSRDWSDASQPPVRKSTRGRKRRTEPIETQMEDGSKVFLSPKEYRSHRRRITNRESARRMRKKRHEERVTSQQEVRVLINDNEALRKSATARQGQWMWPLLVPQQATRVLGLSAAIVALPLQPSLPVASHPWPLTG
ncbi:hypothetical protein WJX73_004465 [Symbiochloris irregularis]|uniref:BZIP domain-containing protein n=1 Tax=Symbiochloris irregularis TaxID=706552 RepID=A0AAW1PEH7_9CHLO